MVKNKAVLSKSEKLEKGVETWASFYRSNPHIFVKEYLNINLKLFQQILIYFMMHYNQFCYIASRGQGKTFLTAIFCCVRCILFPETKVIVASGTLKQAIQVIEKITEIRNNSVNLKREIKYLSTGVNNPRVDFKNGSWIQCVPSTDNARSARANLLIVDEFRQVNLQIINKVLRKFLTAPRNPRYLSKPEYKNNKELIERNKEIYLSSAYYKHHWSWDRCKTFFKAMTEGMRYFICSLPYQLAIKEGLLSEEQIQEEKQEADFDAIGFEMEMQSLFFGANEKGFFNFESFDRNRVITDAIYLREKYGVVEDKNFKYPPKKKNTIRILSCDIAGRGGEKNDASAFTILDATPNNSKTQYRIEIPFLTTLNGGHTEIQTIKIKQLFKDFECDYLVLDIQNFGLGLFDSLSSKTFDKENGVQYEALNCMNDDSLKERCLEPDAKQVIYAISGTPKLNSDCAKLLKDRIERGMVKFLIGENDARTYLMNYKGYYDLPIEDKAELEKPYRQTTALINEMINLDCEYKDGGIVRLKEQGNKRKDRYSSLSYGVYFANVLELENLRVDYSDDDDPLVFF